MPAGADLDGDDVARAVRGQHRRHVVHRAHVRAGHLLEHVALAHPGRLGRRARLDAARREPPSGAVAPGDAEVGALDVARRSRAAGSRPWPC